MNFFSLSKGAVLSTPPCSRVASICQKLTQEKTTNRRQKSEWRFQANTCIVLANQCGHPREITAALLQPASATKKSNNAQQTVVQKYVGK